MLMLPGLEELETAYDANPVNCSPPNNQYGEQLLKRDPRRPKTVSTQTSPRNVNEFLGLDEARIGNSSNNDLRFSSWEQGRYNGEQVKLVAKVYETLKRPLEITEHVNVLSVPSGSLWKADWKQLKIELNKALINSECKSLTKDFVKTPSTSASKNNSYRKNIRLYSIEKDRLLLKKGLPDMNVSHPLRIHTYSFLTIVWSSRFTIFPKSVEHDGSNLMIRWAGRQVTLVLQTNLIVIGETDDLKKVDS